MVHDEALTELHHLQALPPSSYKWTWGKQLTEQEVLHLHQTGTWPGRTPHSGYDVSLIEGRMLGEYSQTQSHPTSHGHPEEVASSIASIPPSTNLDIPSYFSREDCQTHDPLHIAQPSSLQQYLPSKSVSAQSLPVLELAPESAYILGMEYVPGSELVPGKNYHITLLWLSDSELNQGDHLTEIWSSASDTDETLAPAQVPEYVPAHQSPVGIPPHDWSSESDTDEAPAPAPAPTDMQHVAKDWSSADGDHLSMDDQYTENSQLVISPSWITLDSSVSM